LEWVTPAENLLHAYKKLGRGTNFTGRSFVEKPIIQKTKDGDVIRVWKSCAEASRHFNRNPCIINNAVRGKHKTSLGYKWERA
jgi:hypothetical protein